MRAIPWHRWLLIAGEGLLIPLAYAVGWWFEINPAQHVSFTVAGIAMGLAATLPMLVGFWLLATGRMPRSARLRELVDELLVPFFARWNIGEMLLIAAAAGIGEEFLFRGVLQDGMSARYGWPMGLAVASLLFGVVHYLNAEYAVYATLVGVYLGALYLLTGNLLIPIVAHGAYDFVALVYVSRQGRRSPIKLELG